MNIRKIIFKNRSYTPIPFFLVAIYFANPILESLVIGFFVALLGEFIRFWGVSICGSETRTTENVGATNLITNGPFGYVRNPLYVGNILMYVGCTIMSFAFFPQFVIFTFLFFAIQYSLIVSVEEDFLINIYKTEYENYCKNVPRFIPRFKEYITENAFKRSADFKRGLKSEIRTLQAFSIITILLVLKYFKMI